MILSNCLRSTCFAAAACQTVRRNGPNSPKSPMAVGHLGITACDCLAAPPAHLWAIGTAAGITSGPRQLLLWGRSLDCASSIFQWSENTPDILWMSRGEYHILLFYHPNPEPDQLRAGPHFAPADCGNQLHAPTPFPDSSPAPNLIQRLLMVQTCGFVWIVRKTRTQGFSVADRSGGPIR